MSPLYCHLYESNLVYNSTLPTPLTSKEYSLESIQLSCLQILHLSILFFATVSRKVKSPSVTSLLMAPSTVHMHQTLQSTMGEIDCKLKLTSVVYYKFCVFLEKLYETLGSDKYILLS